MTHFFALMLWVAGILAFIAGLPQLGVAIFVVVVVNGVFAFVQESRAEHAAERLRDLLPRRAIVVRDGVPVEIDAAELVVDDLVLLVAGDRVSADLRVTESHALRMDTSLLTGESVPVPAAERDELFAGTFVVEGEGRAVVEAVGATTRLAAIAQLTQVGHRPRSPLALELDRVVRTVAMIAVGVGVAFFGVSLAIGSPASDGFLFAIGVTVALVPEGLLPTVTLSLAMGAQRMAGRHALVRRLESVETLGSTTFICTDKTGTLTRNEMTVIEVWTPAGTARIAGSGYDPTAALVADPAVVPSLRLLARAAARCSTGRAVERDGRWIALGDPMEAAIDTFARRLGIDVAADEAAHPVLRRYPFDPRRRRMSLIVDDRLFVKGATDALLARCDQTAGRTRGARGDGESRPAGAGRRHPPCRGHHGRHPSRRRRGPARAVGPGRAGGPAPSQRGGGDRRLPAGRDPGRHGHRRPPGDGASDRRRGRPAWMSMVSCSKERISPKTSRCSAPCSTEKAWSWPGSYPRTSCASPGPCRPEVTSSP